MKKNQILAVMATVMVIAATMISCKKENVYDFVNVQASEVSPADPVVDTTFVIDTVVFNDTVNGSVIEKTVVFSHGTYGDWQGNGATRQLVATHQIKVYTKIDGVLTIDSATFAEHGTLTVAFPSSYSSNMDGTYNVTSNGDVPQMQATVSLTWEYEPAICGGEDYSDLFNGGCELTPTTMVVSGSNVTVNTVHGNTSRPAVFTITLEIPDTPTVVSRSVAFRHVSYGNWTGTGNTRTITATHRVIETTLWSDGSTTVDSADFAEQGTLTASFPVYNSNVDGSYTVVNGVCSQIGATVNVSWQYGQPVVQGRNYSSQFNGNCALTPTTVTINGTNATVNTVHGNTSRPANFTITLEIPTPQDTINKFGGQLLYWAITASYNSSSQSSSDVDWFLCVVVNDGGQKRVKYSPLAATAAGLSFTDKGVITNAEFTNLVNNSNFSAAAESGLRSGLAMAYHHDDNTILDITRVKYSLTSNQVKYYTLSGDFHSAHSAIGQTLGNVSSAEPVRDGGVKTGNGIFTFIYNGEVVK